MITKSGEQNLRSTYMNMPLDDLNNLRVQLMLQRYDPYALNPDLERERQIQLIGQVKADRYADLFRPQTTAVYTTESNNNQDSTRAA